MTLSPFMLGEEHLVVGVNVGPVAEFAHWGRHDEVFRVVGEAGEHTVHIVGRFEHEVLVDELVHLGVAHRRAGSCSFVGSPPRKTCIS